MIKLMTLIALCVSGLYAADNAPEAMQPANEYGDCVEKYRSSWGEECAQCTKWNDSYVIHLRNTCSESIDVMVCVQETDKKWRRFQHTGMAPRDSLRACVCVGRICELNAQRE